MSGVRVMQNWERGEFGKVVVVVVKLGKGGTKGRLKLFGQATGLAGFVCVGLEPNHNLSSTTFFSIGHSTLILLNLCSNWAMQHPLMDGGKLKVCELQSIGQ